MYGFPGVVGAVDYTHVAIVLPKTYDTIYPEHMYVNRKKSVPFDKCLIGNIFTNIF